MSDQRGFTLIELLVTIAAGSIVMLAIFALVDVSSRSALKVDQKVEANQKARPVLQRIFDELHSTCLGPNTTPVLAGSTDTSMSFISDTGADVNPVPDKHVVTLAGGTLTETVYPVSGGTAPNWTFSSTPSSTRTLLTEVGQGSTGSPPTNPPVFQYFEYVNGDISSTRLPTPLSAADASTAAQVTMSFSVVPTTTRVIDPKSGITVSDSAILRLTPADEDTSANDPPCA